MTLRGPRTPPHLADLAANRQATGPNLSGEELQPTASVGIQHPWPAQQYEPAAGRRRRCAGGPEARITGARGTV